MGNDSIFIIKKIKEWWSNWESPNKGMIIVTGFLAFGTFYLAVTSQRNVRIQKQQFILVNRAKINPKPPGERIVGGIDGGKLVFENTGNLSAEEFRLIWKIVKIDGYKVVKSYPEPRSENNILSLDKIEEKSEEKVSPEDTITIPYKSEYNIKTDERVLLMVVAWKYKGRGIEGYMLKDASYLWNNEEKKPYWGVTDKLGYGNVLADISARNTLRQFLEQDEKN